MYLYEMKYKIDLTKPFESVEKKAEEMLRDLYLTIPKKNKLKELVLFNCHIKNPYILTRLPLHKLTTLDLSLNKITNVNFIRNMRNPNMNTLYLNHNKISDIKVLLNKKDFGELKVISLNKNPIDFDKKKNDIIDLSNKGIIVDIIDGHFEEDEYDTLGKHLLEKLTKGEIKVNSKEKNSDLIK